jgi:DNA (cytosine-5)-methyltransferase 1
MARYGKWPHAIPTPTVNDSRSGRNKTAKRANPLSAHHDGTTLVDYVSIYPTPTASERDTRPKRYMRGNLNLAAVVTWPTPRASDATGGQWKNPKRPGGPGLKEVTPGALNPTWVEWLMGFPLGWTDLDASEMPSSPKSPSG